MGDLKDSTQGGNYSLLGVPPTLEEKKKRSHRQFGRGDTTVAGWIRGKNPTQSIPIIIHDIHVREHKGGRA